MGNGGGVYPLPCCGHQGKGTLRSLAVIAGQGLVSFLCWRRIRPAAGCGGDGVRQVGVESPLKPLASALFRPTLCSALRWPEPSGQLACRWVVGLGVVAPRAA